MIKTLRLYQIGAFTNKIFRGNPAGVISNADGLSDQQMQDIARELNNSETAFIFRPTDKSHDLRVRFFTPTVEVPSCGHASISAGYVWAKENNITNSVFRQKIQIGTLPLEIINSENNQMTFMTQASPFFGKIIRGRLLEQILKALGLNPSDVCENLPVQIVSTGHGKLLIPLKRKSTLNSIKPNYQNLIEISDKIGQNGFFPFVLDESEKGILSHARMFAPKIGINEDPVTGNGNGPLGAYLVKHKAVKYTHELRFISHQGEAINRSGYAHVIVDIENDEPINVKVGGNCITVFKTSMQVRIDKNKTYDTF